MVINSILFFLLCYHLLWATFSLLVHRSIIHKQYVIDKNLAIVFRFILWVVMGLAYQNWQQHLCALHRKHHRFSDQKEDPCSPHLQSLRELLDYKHNDPNKPRFIGPKDLATYAPEIKTDTSQIEQFYQKHPTLGLTILWGIYTLLFGISGFIIGAIHRFFITDIVILTADWGTHKLGFRYVKLPNSGKAVNMFPIGILLAGEELHANHHLNPNRLNLAMKWFEFDLGYWYVRFFAMLGLMRINTN